MRRHGFVLTQRRITIRYKYVKGFILRLRAFAATSTCVGKIIGVETKTVLRSEDMLQRL